jgi:quercetin dioxygenase-like cupin family protein
MNEMELRQSCRMRLHRASIGGLLHLLISALILSLLPHAAFAAEKSSPIQVETVLQTITAWDGSTYKAYPGGQPQLSVLKITIPPHTSMPWHTHPMPNVAYILSGELTVEKMDGSAKQHFVAGQAIPETVDTAHRGVTGDKAVELIVFYSGALDMPLSKPAAPPAK